jgi:hypothetical protein
MILDGYNVLNADMDTRWSAGRSNAETTQTGQPVQSVFLESLKLAGIMRMINEKYIYIIYIRYLLSTRRAE